jgi:23S rRNA pseudouridine1911/1915/1917 synthase
MPEVTVLGTAEAMHAENDGPGRSPASDALGVDATEPLDAILPAEDWEETQQQCLPPELAGSRLDVALARVFPAYSRNQLTQWLREGALTVDGVTPRPRERVRGGEAVSLRLPPPPLEGLRAEPIPLEILHADSALIVVNKPAGLVVHPAVGHASGTLVNALLHQAPELRGLPRAGIVHRLDKETTGLLVVARTPRAQYHLSQQIQTRRLHREYRALVQGRVLSGGMVEAPLGRHPVDRKRMAVVTGGRWARTHYRILEAYRAHTLLQVRLETGRTHQIRVHMAHRGHAVVGDPVYGGRLHAVRGMSPDAAAHLASFRRQALHAAVLIVRHPDTDEEQRFEAPLPEDFAGLLAALQADAAAEPLP